MLRIKEKEMKRAGDSRNNSFNILANHVCLSHLSPVSQQPSNPVLKLCVLLAQDGEAELDEEREKVSCRGICHFAHRSVLHSSVLAPRNICCTLSFQIKSLQTRSCPCPSVTVSLLLLQIMAYEFHRKEETRESMRHGVVRATKKRLGQVCQLPEHEG